MSRTVSKNWWYFEVKLWSKNTKQELESGDIYKIKCWTMKERVSMETLDRKELLKSGKVVWKSDWAAKNGVMKSVCVCLCDGWTGSGSSRYNPANHLTFYLTTTLVPIPDCCGLYYVYCVYLFKFESIACCTQALLRR